MTKMNKLTEMLTKTPPYWGMAIVVHHSNSKLTTATHHKIKIPHPRNLNQPRRLSSALEKIAGKWRLH